MVLGETFRRGIENTLILLDEALCEFEQWANGREQRSVLYGEHNPLSPSQRQTILREIARIRQLLQTLQDDLELHGRVRNGANVIWGKCALLDINLEELKGRHLAGYGKPPAELVAYLDPKIDQLRASVNQLFQSVANRKT